MKTTRKDIFPSDNEASKMPPGPWPSNQDANNPYTKPLNKEAEQRQEQKQPLK